MGKKESFFQDVASANEGIEVKDVRNLYIWYDLLSYLLPFQLIFILVYSVGSKYYSLTILSLFFILITDFLITKSLEKDGKNFTKFQKYIDLVKLWVVPLAIMSVGTTICLLVVTFGII